MLEIKPGIFLKKIDEKNGMFKETSDIFSTVFIHRVINDQVEYEIMQFKKRKDKNIGNIAVFSDEQKYTVVDLPCLFEIVEITPNGLVKHTKSYKTLAEVKTAVGENDYFIKEIIFT